MKPIFRRAIAYALSAAFLSSLPAQDFIRKSGVGTHGEASTGVAILPSDVGGGDYVAISGYSVDAGVWTPRYLDAAICQDYFADIALSASLPYGWLNDIIVEKNNWWHVAAGTCSASGASNSSDVLMSVGTFNTISYSFSFGTTTHDETAHSVVEMGSDEFVVAGTRWDGSNPSDSKAFVTRIKISNTPSWSASVVWSVEFGDYNTSANDIVLDGINNVLYVGGTANMPGTGNTERCAYVATLDPSNGNVLNDHAFESGVSTSNYQIESIALDPSCSSSSPLYACGTGKPSSIFVTNAFVVSINPSSLAPNTLNHFSDPKDKIHDLMVNQNGYSGGVPVVAVTGSSWQSATNIDGVLLEMEYCSDPDNPTLGYGVYLDGNSNTEDLYAITYSNFWSAYVMVGGSTTSFADDHFHVSHPMGSNCSPNTYSPSMTQLTPATFVPGYTSTSLNPSVSAPNSFTRPSVPQNPICQPTCRMSGSTENDALLAEEALTIFPNPVASTLSIQCIGNWESDILIYDVKGALVKTITGAEPNLTVDLSQLQSGIYLLARTTLSGEVKTAKFVRE